MLLILHPLAKCQQGCKAFRIACRLPCHLNEMLGKIARCEREFMSDHRRMPKMEELAQMLKMPVDKVRMIRVVSPPPPPHLSE